MNKVVDANSNMIGWYCGATIYNLDWTVLYRILEGDIFSPMKHEPSGFQVLYKGLLGHVGEIRGNSGFAKYNEMIFTIFAIDLTQERQ